MSFGEILHKIRKEEDESLRDLSKRVELSHVYISQVEKSERPISKNAFCKILEAYPKHEHKLIQAYLQDVLPESIVTKVLNDTSLILKEGTEQELINYLLYKFYTRKQKISFGTYDITNGSRSQKKWYLQ